MGKLRREWQYPIETLQSLIESKVQEIQQLSTEPSNDIRRTLVTEKEYSEQVMELVIGLCLLDEAHKRESANAKGTGLPDPGAALVRAMATAKSFAPRTARQSAANGGARDANA